MKPLVLLPAVPLVAQAMMARVVSTVTLFFAHVQSLQFESERNQNKNLHLNRFVFGVLTLLHTYDIIRHKTKTCTRLDFGALQIRVSEC